MEAKYQLPCLCAWLAHLTLPCLFIKESRISSMASPFYPGNYPFKPHIFFTYQTEIVRFLSFFFYLFFETVSHCSLAGLELTEMHPPLPPESWDKRCTSAHVASRRILKDHSLVGTAHHLRPGPSFWSQSLLNSPLWHRNGIDLCSSVSCSVCLARCRHLPTPPPVSQRGFAFTRVFSQSKSRQVLGVAPA